MYHRQDQRHIPINKTEAAYPFGQDHVHMDKIKAMYPLRRSKLCTHEQDQSYLPTDQNYILIKFSKAEGICTYMILFVLRFYGPVNPMGSCRVLSVYLTTRSLGRLSPLSG